MTKQEPGGIAYRFGSLLPPSAEGKWLWATRIALTEDEGFEDELDDLEYAQFFYTGSRPVSHGGDVPFVDAEYDEDGYETSITDTLVGHLDSTGEDFGQGGEAGVDKPSIRQSRSRGGNVHRSWLFSRRLLVHDLIGHHHCKLEYAGQKKT